MRETARSAHGWGKGWEIALAVLQEGSEETPKTELHQICRQEPFGEGSGCKSVLGQGGA